MEHPQRPHMRMVSFARTAARLFALAMSLLPICVLAARWVPVGDGSVPTDRVFVDADSVQTTDGITTAEIATQYAEPRTNSHNLRLDRHVQHTAFNCAERSFVGIQTLAYLGEKRVGSNAATVDWQSKFKPIGTNPMGARIYAIVCAPAAVGGAATAPPKPKTVTGSGFVVDESGYVLTNNHVVKDCKSILVKALDLPPRVASVEAVDPKNDLAVLRVPGPTLLGAPKVRDRAARTAAVYRRA